MGNEKGQNKPPKLNSWGWERRRGGEGELSLGGLF